MFVDCVTGGAKDANVSTSAAQWQSFGGGGNRRTWRSYASPHWQVILPNCCAHRMHPKPSMPGNGFRFLFLHDTCKRVQVVGVGVPS